MPASKIGSNVTVWSLGGSAVVGQLHNAEMEFEVKTAEAKGISDTDDWPQEVGRAFTVRGEMEIIGSAFAMGTANSSTPTLVLAFTTGAATYAGTAVLTRASHRVERDGLQMLNVELKGRGAMTVTV